MKGFGWGLLSLSKFLELFIGGLFINTRVSLLLWKRLSSLTTTLDERQLG